MTGRECHVLPAGGRCWQHGLFALQASYLFSPFWPSFAGPPGDEDPAVWISPRDSQTLPAPAAPSALSEDQPPHQRQTLFFWLARHTHTRDIPMYFCVHVQFHLLPNSWVSRVSKETLCGLLSMEQGPLLRWSHSFSPKPGQKLMSRWAEGHI